MLAGQDITFIVNKLKEAPFDYADLTGPTFSEKSPDELRQLVSDVFGKVSPVVGMKDISTEDPERTTTRLLDFLRFVKYKPEVDELTLRNGWNSGEHEVIFSALKWVLNNLPRCERYAYVGYFMNDVQVPPDYGMDHEIQDLLQQCHELQRQFVEAHKEAGRGGGGASSYTFYTVHPPPHVHSRLFFTRNSSDTVSKAPLTTATNA